MFETARCDSRLGPFEGSRVLIAGISKAVDGLTDLLGVGGIEVSQDSLGQDAEPDLDLVQPESMCGRVVEVD